MYDLTIKDNLITICFEEFEELFRSSEVLYRKGFNVFPFFMNREKILKTPYLPHFHQGIEEKRPHLHIIYGDEEQLNKIRELL